MEYHKAWWSKYLPKIKFTRKGSSHGFCGQTPNKEQNLKITLSILYTSKNKPYKLTAKYKEDSKFY